MSLTKNELNDNAGAEMLFNKEESELLCALFEFANKHRVSFYPIQDILVKVRKMAANNRRCICKPDERVCPCVESIDELNTSGRCHCWLFCTYAYGTDYLIKYIYIKDGKALSESERKYELALLRKKK